MTCPTISISKDVYCKGFVEAFFTMPSLKNALRATVKKKCAF